MAVAYRKNPHDPRNNAYVARITLCKGVPIYGFHVGWRFYLKIYMLNPAYMQRLADLLRNGSIMTRPMQPYEVHIPYLLQFMADYGLYGCGWVECRTVTFRAPVPDYDSTDQSQIWSAKTIPSHMITASEDKPRLSHCAIEIDLLSHHISNRDTIKPRPLHHDFVERSNPIPVTEKLVHSMAELWRDEERRRLMRGEDTQQPPSMYVSGSRHDEDDRGNGPWIHEAEMRAKLEELISSERGKSDFHDLQFDTFVKPAKFQSLVQTALESVTDLFPSELPSSSQRRAEYVGINSPSGHLRENGGDFPTAEIDQGRIFEMLESNARTSQTGESYISETPSESLSDVDFDRDLLGRKPEVSSEPVTPDENFDSFDYLPLEMAADTEIPDFSDDFDINFDGLGATSNAQASKSIRESTTSHGIAQLVTDGKNVSQPLRLRGGASPSDLKKRKRAPDSSSASARKKAKVEVASSVDHRSAAEDDHSQSMPQPPEKSVEEKSVYDYWIQQQTKHAVPAEHLKKRSGSVVYCWATPPPSARALLSSLDQLGIPRLIPRSAFYSKDEDVPGYAREYGGREFKLVSASLPYLENFDSRTNFTKSVFSQGNASPDSPISFTKIWQIERKPPILVARHFGSTNRERILSSMLKSGNILVFYWTDSRLPFS